MLFSRAYTAHTRCAQQNFIMGHRICRWGRSQYMHNVWERVAYVWRIHHRNINNKTSHFAYRTRTQTSVAPLLPAENDVVANDNGNDDDDDDRIVGSTRSVSVSHRWDGLLRASNIYHGSSSLLHCTVYFWIVKSVQTVIFLWLELHGTFLRLHVQFGCFNFRFFFSVFLVKFIFRHI